MVTKHRRFKTIVEHATSKEDDTQFHITPAIQVLCNFLDEEDLALDRVKILVMPSHSQHEEFLLLWQEE
ncbi:hypothetical protein KKC87_00120 [Patescibacteria group bacterium]|nr:hypothetical protein [Patescibacteria group bacterium]